ncbi:MAG TPA: hypothetical protein VKD90_20295 [Gemmataceae bacterium]|nr:hypothetical protein [Gemmataceae bacterium]
MAPSLAAGRRARPARHSLRTRRRLAFDSLEERAVPANNLTIEPVGFNDKDFIRVQSNGPTTTIRTKAPDAHLSLTTIQEALQDAGARTVIVTSDVANGQGANNGHQAGNITWDAAAVGSLNFNGFGTGKTLIFRTVDEQGAVGDITLSAVEFINGGSDDQISLEFDSSDPGGNITFQSAGALTPTVMFGAEAVRELTVTAGTGAFSFTDGGFFTPGDVGGDISISAGSVNIAHSSGLTATGSVSVTSAGAVTLASGTGLLAHGNLSITAGAAVNAADGGLTSETAAVAVSGTVVNLDNLFVTAPGGLTVAGSTSVTLSGGTFDLGGDVSITGGTVSLANLALSGQAVDDVTVSGSALTLDGVFLAAGDQLTLTGPATVQGSVEAHAGGSLAFSGAVDGSADLILAAGGTLSIGGNVGAGTPLNSFTLLDGNLNLGSHDLNAAQVVVGQGSSPVEATLGLSGAVTGSVVVEPTGNLAPGGVGTVGVLTVAGDVSFNGGDFAVDFGQGGGFDQLLVLGHVSIAGGSRLGGGLGSGQLTGPATLINYTSGLTGAFANAAIGTPVLVGTDVVTVVAYVPQVIVIPFQPPGGAGSTVTGFDPTDTTIFKATLTGGGQLLSGTDANGDLFLVARNTTPLSRLTVTTTANGSDDIVTFAGGVLVSGPLALFSAPKVNVAAQLRASGVVTSASFRDFVSGTGGTGVQFGGAPAQLTTIAARNILGSVRTGSTLTSLKVAQSLGAAPPAESVLSAPAIGTVTAGSATIDVTTPGRVTAFKVTGDFVGDVSATSIGTLSARNLTGNVDATGAITSIKATAAFTGTVNAASLGTFTAAGGSAVLRTTGAITSIVGTGGNELNLELSASRVGTVKVTGVLSGDAVSGTTDWNVTGGINGLTASAITGLDLTAKFLGAVLVNGSSIFGLSGDVTDSTFTLTGNDGTLAANGLKSLTVTGNVFFSRFDVRAGNAGPVAVGRFHNSQLWVGYTPAPSGTFTAGSFVPGAFRLASFKTTAIPTTLPHPLQWAFQGSEVAADRIGTVTLSGLQSNNGTTPFGIKVGSAGAIVKVVKADPTFPAALLNVALSASLNPIAGDFYFLNV